MKTVRSWLLLGLVSPLFPAMAAAQQESVAKLGTPLKLEIRGAEAFKADEVRQELLTDLDIANACYPTTSIAELCLLFENKAREGYLHAGFADVTIAAAANADGDGIDVTIVEGQRYLAGDVVVRGTETIDGASLARDLTEAPASEDGRPSKSGRTLWRTGKPAWFNQSARRWFREEIESRLLERGMVDADFTVDLVPDRERAVATLAVEFADEGAPAVITEITVTGNKKNTTEEVLGFLGLHAGMPFAGDLDKIAERKLWESGRFTKSKVKLRKRTSVGEPLALTINVVEYDKAPPLKQELSREEAALTKLACWLDRFHDSDEEAVLTFDDAGDTVEIVVAPRRGVIALVHAAEDKKSGTPFAFAFVLSDDRMAIYSTKAKRKLEGIPTPPRVRGNVDINLHDGPPKLTGYGTLKFGLGLNSTRRTQGLCRVRFTDTPVSLLSLAHEYDSKLSWNKDTLTVAYDDRQLVLNAAGNIFEQKSWTDGSLTTVAKTEGMFERRLKEIDAAAAGCVIDTQTNRPLAAALELYCDTALAELTGKDDTEDRKYCAVLRKLSSLGILEPFDRMVTAACRAPDDEFFVPVDRSDTFSTESDEINWSAFKYWTGQLGIRHADFMVGREGWTAAAWREAMFALVGKSRHLDQELVQHLSASESGPVRHLIVGELLHANAMQAMARVFGLAGQTRLSIEGFRNDYSAFLGGQGFVADCFLTWADVIRHLDEAELKTLCDALVEDEFLDRSQANVFAQLVRRLRQHGEAPIASALPAVLDAWWQMGLRDFVKTQLQALVVEPKPVIDGRQLAGANAWRYRWHRGQWWYYGQNGTWRYWTGDRWASYRPAMATRPRFRRR